MTITTIPALRPHLRRVGVWSFFGVGLLLLAPNLLWNMEHSWVTITHTKDNAKLGGSLFHLDHLWSFFSTQFAVFGPVLFAVLLGAGLFRRGDQRLDPRLKLLQCFSLPYLGFYLALSFVSGAHANWAAPAYVAATILVVAWLLESTRRHRWLVGSLVFHIAGSAALMTYPWSVHALSLELDKRKDLFWRQRGQRLFGEAVANLLSAEPHTHLLCDDRKVIAPLIYYVRPHPFDALKWDPDGVAHDHYELVSRPEERLGEDFLLVTELGAEKRYAPYFERVSFVTTIRVPVYSSMELSYRVYRLHNFKGYGNAKPSVAS